MEHPSSGFCIGISPSGYRRGGRAVHEATVRNCSHQDRKDYVLKIKKNIYGQKQAARVWNLHLRKGLEDIGFKQSNIDECLFYKGNTLFMFYVDDGIIVSPKNEEIDEVITQLKEAKFNIEDMGEIGDYLGINFDYMDNGDIKLSQPHLIDKILNQVQILTKKGNVKYSPAASTKIIHRHENEESHDESLFHYRSVIGKLNFLDKGSRPDIAYASHQCARHSVDPKKSHTDAIMHICKYLKGTIDKGLLLRPRKDQSIKVYVDADFCGSYDKLTSMDDISTAKSRTGYVIMFCGCPIIWNSKLQTQIALSTTEAEYIGLSQALRDMIPIIELLKEMKKKGIDIHSTSPNIYCTVFEDNNGALELARVPKMRSRTKHINIVYHHFRSFVKRRIVNVYPIDTKQQLADIFTKALDVKTFIYSRQKIMG